MSRSTVQPLAPLPSTAGSFGQNLKAGINGVSWGSPTKMFSIVGHRNIAFVPENAPGSLGNDTSSSSRRVFIAVNNLSFIRLFIHNTYAGSNVELVGFGTVIYRAAVEYNGVSTPITAGGQSTFTCDQFSAGFTTDSIGVIIPAGATFYIRFFAQVPSPPTAVAAGAAVAGGNLAAGTYFWTVTAIGANNTESWASSEVTQSTSGSNLTVPLTWTPPANLTVLGYKIYRSTGTGTETLVAHLNGSATGYNDSGYGQMVSTTTPPAKYRFIFTNYLGTGDSGNGQGNQPDVTGSTGAMSSTGPSTVLACCPYVVLGDDVISPGIVGMGDSIQAGIGPVAANSQRGGASESNWFNQGFSAGGYNALNTSVAGATLQALIDGSQNYRTRLALSQYGDIIISNLGHNDMYSFNATWQTVALNHMTAGKLFKKRGNLYFPTTLTPSTVSIDNFLSTSGQSVSNTALIETQRLTFNVWLRNGYQVDGSGNPVLTGGVMSSPYIDGIFDLAAPVEVDANNVLTLGGGFWAVPTVATLAGNVLTGSPTQTSFPVLGGISNNGLNAGKIIRMTSGAAVGQTAMIIANGTTTAYVLAANGAGGPTGRNYIGLTVTPASGDTFDILANNTFEGVHGSLAGYTAMAGPFTTWIPTVLAKFF